MMADDATDGNGFTYIVDRYFNQEGLVFVKRWLLQNGWYWG